MMAQPWLRHVPPFRGTFAELGQMRGQIFDFIDRQTAKTVLQQQSTSSSSSSTSLLSQFLECQRQEKEEEGGK
jgi:hypothetical protein